MDFSFTNRQHQSQRRMWAPFGVVRLRSAAFIAAAVVMLAPAMAAAQQAHTSDKPQSGMRELFPHIRVDVEAKIIEVDASVPIVVNDPEAPVVYLELIACTPGTREHEVLVVTPARPSHLHAALLLLGLQPGKPGSWTWEGDKLTSHPPTGDAVSIDLIYTNDQGERLVEPAWSWVKNELTGKTLGERNWVFAGSRMVSFDDQEVYDADGDGTIIGLTTFGSETLAWPDMISPDAGVEEPVWIADARRVPRVDTPVIIRIRPAANHEQQRK